MHCYVLISDDVWPLFCRNILWMVPWQPLAVLSGSLSCSWVYWVTDATPSSFQTGAFMVWTHRYTCTYSYKYVLVHTGTYYYALVCTSTYWYLWVFTTLFRCWAAGVCAGHHCSGPALSLQHHRWYRQCSLCRLFVCTPPAILQVPPESYWLTVP